MNDAASSQNTKPAETIATKSGIKRGRKRIHTVTTLEQEPNPPKRVAFDYKSNKEKESKNGKEQIQLQELYYATMDGEKNLILKEYKSSLYFKVCFIENHSKSKLQANQFCVIIFSFIVSVSHTHTHTRLFI